VAKEVPSLIDAIQKASVKDIETIDATVLELQGKQQEIQRTIDGLSAIRKAIDLRINGKPPRAARQMKKEPSAATTAIAKATGSDGDDDDSDRARDRQKIYDYLHRIGRPAKPSLIGAGTGIDGRTVMALCRHPWFVSNVDEGISIAKR